MGSPAQTTKVGLVQINNTFSHQHYLPLSVGMLQAYAQTHLKNPERFEFLLPIYRRVPVEEAARSLNGADVVFFSCYVWNFRISLEIARKIKEESPGAIVVFGGPHIPDKAEEFIAQHRQVDIVVHGEGEQTALDILENLDGKAWERIPGITLLRMDGSLVHNAKRPRMANLSIAPSPYLNGIFESLIQANPGESWMALWETNRGCPFSCTFCDWGSATQTKVNRFDLERLYAEVDWFAANKIEYVYCCDANFGILPRDLDIARYTAVTKGKTGYPHRLSVFNTKNAQERAYDVQKLLADAGLHKGVDIALQSMDEHTLKTIKRDNISLEAFQQLQQRFTRDGVATYTDMIFGLPGETYHSFADGVSTGIASGQHNRMRFGVLSILPNAEMGDPEYQRKYGMVTVEAKATNSHASLAELEGEIYETEVRAIATNAMPKDDWVKTSAFCILTTLLHFDKLLQIPFVLLHELCSISYRELLENFTGGNLDAMPVMAEARSLAQDHSNEMQMGGPQFVRSEEWLNVQWPPDEYAFIKLCIEGKLHHFYEEAERVLNRTLQEQALKLPLGLLHEALVLNSGLVKLPFQVEDLKVRSSYNIWEFYRSALTGTNISLEQTDCQYLIDRTSNRWSSWDEWCREVVWYGNSTGAYLYDVRTINPELVMGSQRTA